MCKVYRNYTNDKPMMYLKIYTAIRECFDKQKTHGVDKEVTLKHVMKTVKGSCAPRLISKLLEEFEKGT